MILTKNFALEELTASETANRLKINNTPPAEVQAKLRLLCEYILQPLREAYGKPIIVSSAYRCDVLNRAVGGASNSDHKFGCAADIHTLSNVPACNKELFDIAVNLMRNGKLKHVKQIIDEYNYKWIHISYQDGRTIKRNQVLHLG